MLAQQELLEYDASIFEIYIKLFLIQIRSETEAIEVDRVDTDDGSDKELTVEQKDQIAYIVKNLASNKYCFLYRLMDKTYLLARVHVQGIIVYKDVKENRIILGCNSWC